jgi:hypothetical protein
MDARNERNRLNPEAWDDLWQLSKAKRNRYWAMLKMTRADYYNNMVDNSIECARYENSFYEYVESTYGVRVSLVDNNIGSEYKVVDEKKYLLWLMKYGK